MEIETPICDGCESDSSLTKVHISTGKRGRPPIKFWCDDCMTKNKGTFVIPGQKVEKINGTKVSLATQINLGGFNPAALFLLSLQPDCLFEPASLNSDWKFRCKGCTEIITRPNRLDHFKSHSNLVHQ